MVYIQKFGESFISDFAYSAYEGFSFKGEKIKCFEDINDVPVRFDEYGKIPMVVACIEDTVAYLKKWGIKQPEPLHIPEELISFTHREIQKTTLGEWKKNKTKYPIPCFIKSEELKLFPSGVLREESSRSELMFPYPDNTKILYSNVIEIISEYRCFVNRDMQILKGVEWGLVGIQFYQGDFKLYPDINEIYKMIGTYKNRPAAFTLDVGIIYKDGKYLTVLIECNDGWSVGTYGLDGEKTAKFLSSRWLELTKHILPPQAKLPSLKEKIDSLGGKENIPDEILKNWLS